MFSQPPRPLPTPSIDDLPTVTERPHGPPVPVITVTIGVDPRKRRDPAALDNASPYFATTSEPPRTP
jgi:hypothetical protein